MPSPKNNNNFDSNYEEIINIALEYGFNAE